MTVVVDIGFKVQSCSYSKLSAGAFVKFPSVSALSQEAFLLEIISTVSSQCSWWCGEVDCSSILGLFSLFTSSDKA